MSRGKQKHKSLIRAWKWQFLPIAIVKTNELEEFEKRLKKAEYLAYLRKRIISNLLKKIQEKR